MRVHDLIVLLASDPLARANGRLIEVVPLDGGRSSGPTGLLAQFWDVQPGKTYRFTIQGVVECGNECTAPTINVRLNSTGSGSTDLRATNAGTGTYVFSFMVPANAAGTFAISCSTMPGQPQMGLKVMRNDGAPFPAHLRASKLGPGLTQSTPIKG